MTSATVKNLFVATISFFLWFGLAVYIVLDVTILVVVLLSENPDSHCHHE